MAPRSPGVRQPRCRGSRPRQPRATTSNRGFARPPAMSGLRPRSAGRGSDRPVRSSNHGSATASIRQASWPTPCSTIGAPADDLSSTREHNITFLVVLLPGTKRACSWPLPSSRRESKTCLRGSDSQGDARCCSGLPHSNGRQSRRESRPGSTLRRCGAAAVSHPASADASPRSFARRRTRGAGPTRVPRIAGRDRARAI